MTNSVELIQQAFQAESDALVEGAYAVQEMIERHELERLGMHERHQAELDGFRNGDAYAKLKAHLDTCRQLADTLARHDITVEVPKISFLPNSGPQDESPTGVDAVCRALANYSDPVTISQLAEDMAPEGASKSEIKDFKQRLGNTLNYASKHGGRVVCVKMPDGHHNTWKLPEN